MKEIGFTPKGWEDYQYWLQTDKKVLLRINELIKDCQRNPISGIGKPEKLKGNYTGFYSRRIDDRHRLVYYEEPTHIIFVQCRYHYEE